MPSYVVAGASRGIGYALVKALSANKDNTVIGLVRSVDTAKAKFAAEFPERKNIHIIKGDLEDRKTLAAAVQEVSALTGGSLDVLIANAGITVLDSLPIGQFVREYPEEFEKAYEKISAVNVVGTIHVLALFAPLLEKGTIKKAVVVSSAMGDADLVNKAGVDWQSAYSISKAAINLAVAKFNVEHRDRGILFFAISPGMVDTGIISAGEKPAPEVEKRIQEGFVNLGERFKKFQPDWRGYPLTPDESATYLVDTIDKATIEKDGGIMVSQYGNQTWL